MAAADLSIGSRLDWINHFINLHNSVDSNIRESCGLNITQSRILFYIGTHGPHPIGSVGTSLFLKPSTITASVGLLVDDGYVSRTNNNLDRRQVCIDLTDKGIEITPNFIPAVRKAFEEDCPLAFEDKRDELRALLLPASSRIFFGTDEENITSIAERIARNLKLDQSQEEIITHISRVLVIESISYFLNQLTELNNSIGLSPNEARILRTLASDNTGMRLKDLSTLLNIRQNVVSFSIHNLTERELIDRISDSKDRRAARLTLSRKGARLIRNSNSKLCETIDACYPGLGDHALSEYFAL